MFGQKVEKAQLDWPRDKVDLKKGHVDITGEYPRLRHEMILVLSAFVAFAASLAFVGLLAFLFAVLVPLLLRPVIMKKLDVRIGPEIIRVGGKRYDRSAQPEFRVDHHHRAFLPDSDDLYRHALEVVMQYGEKRIAIAEMRMKERPKAEALALRLQVWCRDFDRAMAQAQKDAGPDTEPAKGDFGPEPDVR